MHHRVLYELPEPARRQLESIRRETAQHDAEVSEINFPSIAVRERTKSRTGHNVDAPRRSNDRNRNKARSHSVDPKWDRASLEPEVRASLPSLAGKTRARGSSLRPDTGDSSGHRPKSTSPVRRLARQSSKPPVRKQPSVLDAMIPTLKELEVDEDEFLFEDEDKFSPVKTPGLSGGNSDFSSDSNRFIERSRELRGMPTMKKQIGLSTVSAALAFKSEGQKGHMKRMMMKIHNNKRQSDHGSQEEEVEEMAASAKTMHKAVITTVGLMKFAKPAASPIVSRDGSMDPGSGMRHYTLAEMGGKGKIWQSHLRQKKKILKRLLEDSVEPDLHVKDWLIGQNDTTIRCKNGVAVSIARLRDIRSWMDEVETQTLDGAGVVSMSYLHLDKRDEEVNLPEFLEPLRLFVNLVKLGRDGGIVAAPENKKKKERIASSPGFMRRFKQGYFNLQDIILACYPYLSFSDLPHLIKTANGLVISRHAHHHRKRGAGRSPDAIAGSIFRLIDVERRSCITYEELEEFLRYVFSSMPLELVLESFGEDTISRLKYEGDKMFKEEFIFWYLNVARACSLPPNGTPMADFCALDPITRLRRFEEVEGKERWLEIKKRTVAKAKTIGALRRAYKKAAVASLDEESGEEDNTENMSSAAQQPLKSRPRDT